MLRGLAKTIRKAEKMPWSVIPSLGTIVLILGTGFAGGWVVNGWRLEARIADLKASYAKAYADAQKAARSREIALQTQADAQRKKKDDQIKNINSRLAAALDGLRDRPTRNDMPPAAGTCGAATGAELSRPDAEFLAGESARADEAVAMLNYCIAQYNSLRP